MSKIDPQAQKRADTKRTTGLPTEVAMWLTPNVPNGGRSVSAELVASKGMTPDGTKRTIDLAAQTQHWPTPNAIEFGAANVEVLNARRAKYAEKYGNNGFGLTLGQHVAAWPTPAARDAKGANSEEHALITGGGRKHMDQLSNFAAYSPQAQVTRDGPTSSPETPGCDQPSPKTKSGRLNPYFGEWLMNWPMGWTSAAGPSASSASETALFRRRQLSHLSSLLDGVE